MTGPDDAVELYLDGLVAAARGLPARELRSLLAETEAHLRDDVQRRVADGVSPDAAATDAVRAFGPASELVRAERRRARTGLAVLAARTFSSAVLLGGVGAVAVGVSGLLAAVLRLVGGARFVVDVAPGQQLAAADCARWLQLDPGAASCRAAAVHDWMGEVVWYRLATGVLGLLLLAGWRVARRTGRAGLLPSPVRDAVAATAFTGAAAYALFRAVDLGVVASGHGSGQWYSAGLVAVVGAGCFAARLARALRTPAVA